MKNEMIKIFENEEFGNVRTVVFNNNIWFIGREIAGILGYGNGNKRSKALTNAISDHVEEEDKMKLNFIKCKELFGEYQNDDPTFKINSNGITIINESGLYSLILSSKLPSAKKFKRWVTSEVLPSIRKHGFYITDEKLKEFLKENPKNIQKVLLSIKQVKFEELQKSNVTLSSNHKKMIVEFVESLNTKAMKRCYTGSFYTKIYQRMYEDYNIDIIQRREEHIEKSGQKSISALAFIQENEIEQFLSAIFNEYVDDKKTLSVLEYNIHKIKEEYEDEYDIFAFLENLIDKYREENKE